MNEDWEFEETLRRLVGPVDRRGVWASIEARAGGQKQSSAPRRRGGLRIAVYAFLVVVLVAAISLGSLEAVKHLGKTTPIIRITDETTVTSEPGQVTQTTGAATAAQGADWKQLPLTSEGGPVSILVMAPSDPSVLYAKTSEGLFKTTDGAESWRKLPSVENDLDVAVIAVDPASSSTVYALAWALPRLENDSPHLLRSDDGGTTWTDLTGKAPPISGPGYFGWRGIIWLDPTSTPSTIYTAGADETASRSSDRGATWTRLSLGEKVPDTAIDGALQSLTQESSVTDADTGLTLVLTQGPTSDPGHPSTLYAGTEDGVYKSTDGGKTWKRASAGLTCSIVSWVVPDPTSASILYAGTPWGIVKSSDGGKNWHKILQGQGSLVIAPSSTSTLYASTGAGLFRSDNGGERWTRLAGTGLKGPRLVLVAADDPDIVFAVGDGGEMASRLFRTTDGGDTWNPVFQGAPPEGGHDLIGEVLADPRNPSTLFAARDRASGELPYTLRHSDHLLKSTDTGATWMVVSPEQWADHAIYDIDIDPQNPSTMYVVLRYYDTRMLSYAPARPDPSEWDSIFRSRDGGGTWEEVPLDGAAMFIPELLVDPRSPDTLYAFTLPADGGSGPAGLYRSTDGGATWQNVIGELSDAPGLSFAISPAAGGVLYATSWRGLFEWLPSSE